MLQLIRERAPEATAVAGPTVGADPIVSAVMLLSAATDQPLAGLLVRSERKDHGTERIIEGPLQRGMRVVIVDDAATTGGSLVHTARCLREAGLDLEVVLAITLVDRLSGFEAAMAEDRRPRRQRVHAQRLHAAGVGGKRRVGRQAMAKRTEAEEAGIYAASTAVGRRRPAQRPTQT